MRVADAAAEIGGFAREGLGRRFLYGVVEMTIRPGCVSLILFPVRGSTLPFMPGNPAD